MSGPSTPDDDASDRRRYDSPVRRRKVAETRERILTAASALVHSFDTWNWDDLTFRAVAELAGVSERTVYRHFATERELHDAVMRRLVEEAGVSYDDLDLGDVADVTARVFASLSSYAVTTWTTDNPTLRQQDDVRRRALLDAVTAAADDWTESDRALAAAALDVLWAPATYERLRGNWTLDADDATAVVTWLLGLVSDAIRTGRRPSAD